MFKKCLEDERLKQKGFDDDFGPFRLKFPQNSKRHLGTFFQVAAKQLGFWVCFKGQGQVYP